MRTLATIFLAIGLAAPAMAGSAGNDPGLEPGKTISFRDPRPLAVGCTEVADANRMKQFNRRNDEFSKQELVDWLSQGKGERTCIVLNASPGTKWKIVKRVVMSDRSAYVCFAAEFDFRPESEQKQPPPCLWLFMS